MRDRATLYLKQLDGGAGGPEAISKPWPVPATNLEKSLHSYLDGPTDAPFLLVRDSGMQRTPPPPTRGIRFPGVHFCAEAPLQSPHTHALCGVQQPAHACVRTESQPQSGHVILHSAHAAWPAYLS